MMEAASKRQKWIVCALLGAAVLAVYWPALHCGFVNYDDPEYVTENWHVLHGVNAADLRWAFTSVAASNWHPLTWWSHMLDCQFYGLAPAGHHLSSLVLHVANAVLLFLLLNRLTGALGRSAIVAAMFAIHPLRVESVVWISERKDVLSAFFWMLTVGAYVRYAEEFKVQSSKFKVFYGLALLFFALGLMAKPMLVTLPFVLLLLDYWPLGRLKFGSGFSWRPVVEKIPFLILSAAASFVTFMVQNSAGAVGSLNKFPVAVRVANIPVAYLRYLTKIFCPVDLSPFYPYIKWPPGEIIAAVVLIAAISGLALWRLRLSPYLAVGWCWFLGMLVPAIGFVQVGGASMADRYSYLPCIGVWIMIVWGLHDLGSKRQMLREGMMTATALVLMLFAALAWRHASVYKDSGTLWNAAVRLYPQSLPVQNNLSRWLIESEQWDQALDHSRQALAILPSDSTAHDNLSRIFLHQGRVDEAIAEGLKSAQSEPRSEVSRQTLARAYLKKGDFAAAAAACREAIRIKPSAPEAWCNLGFALLQQRQVSEAAAAYQKALEFNPDYALAHNDLGNILLHQGRLDEAMEQFQRAVELKPSFAEAHYNLAGILAQRGRIDEAIAHCQAALEAQPGLAPARQRLAELTSARERNSGR